MEAIELSCCSVKGRVRGTGFEGGRGRSAADFLMKSSLVEKQSNFPGNCYHLVLCPRHVVQCARFPWVCSPYIFVLCTSRVSQVQFAKKPWVPIMSNFYTKTGAPSSPPRPYARASHRYEGCSALAPVRLHAAHYCCCAFSVSLETLYPSRSSKRNCCLPQLDHNANSK